MSTWTLLMWMSSVSLPILRCCPHKVMLMTRGTSDEWMQPKSPSKEKSLNCQNSLLCPRLFSLPGQWKVTRCFCYCCCCCYCFCQNCTILEPDIIFKVLDFKEISHLTKHKHRSQKLRLTGQWLKGHPATGWSHLPPSGHTLDSGWKFIKTKMLPNSLWRTEKIILKPLGHRTFQRLGNVQERCGRPETRPLI